LHDLAYQFSADAVSAGATPCRSRSHLFASFSRFRTFSDADVARYARAYTAAEHLRAALEICRAFPANEEFSSAQQSAISVPLVLASGKNSPFEKLMPNFADALRAHGCANVEIEVIENSVHYVADEQPDAVVHLIERHASL
jgi:pimeloyl-ACP methyl ester carboxylesterase